MVYAIFALLGILVLAWAFLTFYVFVAIVKLAFLSVVLSGVVFYLLQNGPARQKLINSLDQYWFIWLPATVMAMVVTFFIATGTIVPFLGWGLRGTPFGYVYAMQFLMWCGVLLVVQCFHRLYRQWLGRLIYNWLGLGGCWRILSQDNSPANSLAVLWLVIVALAFLHGPPLPDWQQQKYEAELAVAQVPQSAFVQAANDWSGQLVGRQVFDTSVVIPAPVPPPPRYQHHWLWATMAFVLAPFAAFGLMVSRRDEVTEWLDRQAGRLRKDASFGRAESEPKQTPSPEQATEQKEKGQSYAEQLGQEVVAEGVVEILKKALATLAVTLSRMLRTLGKKAT